MKHVQAFVTPSSLTPLLQKLREVTGMPAINIRHQQNAKRQEEGELSTELPDELVAPVLEIIQAHSDCLIIVAPEGWMNNPANRHDFARVVEVFPERVDGALNQHGNGNAGAPARRHLRRRD